MPVYFAFICYYSLSGADFLSAQLKLEAPDQIDLLVGLQEKSKAFGLSGFLIKLFPGTDLFSQVSRFCFLSSSLDQETCILRC
jgi:hypothetical protein